MLRCYSQLTADVIFHKLIKKSFIRVCHQIIKPNAGTDKNFFNFGDIPDLSEKLKIILVVYRQILTRRRKQALSLLADSFCQLLFAGRITKISRRASYIMDIALKSGSSVIFQLLSEWNRDFLSEGYGPDERSAHRNYSFQSILCCWSD